MSWRFHSGDGGLAEGWLFDDGTGFVAGQTLSGTLTATLAAVTLTASGSVSMIIEDAGGPVDFNMPRISMQATGNTISILSGVANVSTAGITTDASGSVGQTITGTADLVNATTSIAASAHVTGTILGTADLTNAAISPNFAGFVDPNILLGSMSVVLPSIETTIESVLGVVIDGTAEFTLPASTLTGLAQFVIFAGAWQLETEIPSNWSLEISITATWTEETPP